MNESYDLKQHNLFFRGRPLYLYFFASLSNDELISRLIEGIENNQGIDLLNCINIPDVEVIDTNKIDQIQYALLSGNSALFDGNQTYLMDTKKYPNRSIEEPQAEKSIRGSKDGFNESILNNTGLIRRRIKSKHLVFKREIIGNLSQGDIAVVYMDNLVNKKVLDELLKRIKDIKTNDLIMSDRAFEELIIKQNYNPFPLVRYSERPDIVSSHIMNGHIAIICDTSSSIIMIPITLLEILEDVEEHRQTPLIGTMIRIVRFFGVFLSIYLVPIWAISTRYLQWDYSFFIQLIIVEIAIELLRIATIHTPSSINNAMGLVAALLLGEYAVELGFFSKEILLFGAISSIGGFATPNYELSLTNKYIKIFMIVFIMFFNIYGFIIYNLLLFVYLMHLKPFGLSYLYPIYPLNIKALYRYFIRKPKNKQTIKE